MKSKYQLIEDGTFDKFRELSRNLYKNGLNHNSKDSYKEIFGEDTETLWKIYNSQKQRKYKNKEELIQWCFAIQKSFAYKDYRIVFITLTFDNNVLKTTSKLTRRRYVGRYLNNNTVHYIANIDFSPSEREHYHAIALIKNDMDLSKWKWHILVKNIPIKNNDIKSIFTYVLKLNNHSYKNSTRQERLVKDKNVNDKLEFLIENVWYEEYKNYKVLFNSKYQNL